MFMAQEAYVSALAGDDSESNDDGTAKNRKYFSIFFSVYQSGELHLDDKLVSFVVQEHDQL